jgi:hypothetical protein
MPKIDVEIEDRRRYMLDIEHGLGSLEAEHVSIHDVKLGPNCKAGNRGLVFRLHTPNPGWCHPNGMIADDQDAATLKRHAKTILEALMDLASPRSDRKETVHFNGESLSFSYGDLRGEFISTRPYKTGGQKTYMYCTLIPSRTATVNAGRAMSSPSFFLL